MKPYQSCSKNSILCRILVAMATNRKKNWRKNFLVWNHKAESLDIWGAASFNGSLSRSSKLYLQGNMSHAPEVTWFYIDFISLLSKICYLNMYFINFQNCRKHRRKSRTKATWSRLQHCWTRLLWTIEDINFIII